MALELEQRSDPIGKWIERYGQELRRHVQRLLGEAADVDDVLQEVWLSATRRTPEDGPGSNVRAWFYRVATNAALDELARRRRRDAVARLGQPVAIGEQETTGVTSPGLGERAERRIRDECARLPRKQREAVWLRLVEGLDYEDVARRIDSTVDAARANVYQGSRRLRQRLASLWESESVT